MMILFLGRSTEGILADARMEFPGEQEVLVVKRDGDHLSAPAGIAAVEVSKFQPENAEYVVIANGGTSAQLVPVLKRLVEARVSLKVFDLQRDGVSQLW